MILLCEIILTSILFMNTGAHFRGLFTTHHILSYVFVYVVLKSLTDTVADSKYVVLDDPLPTGHVTRRMRIANFAIKMAHLIDIIFINHSAMDQARNVEFCSKYGNMDVYKIERFRYKGAWLRVT